MELVRLLCFVVLMAILTCVLIPVMALEFFIVWVMSLLEEK